MSMRIVQRGKCGVVVEIDYDRKRDPELLRIFRRLAGFMCSCVNTMVQRSPPPGEVGYAVADKVVMR